MRAAELLRAKELGPIPGDERSATQSAKRLAQRWFDQQSFQMPEAGCEQRRVRFVEHVADVIVGRNFLDAEQTLAIRPALAFLQSALKGQERSALHEKHAKAERPKSATAILPPRPLRESGKAAQTAFKPARRDVNSFIHMVNHFSGNLGIPKLAAATTFRTAAAAPRQLRWRSSPCRFRI